MAGRALTILAVVVFIGAIAGVYLIKNTPTALSDEQAVRALVQNFGLKLQDVSLLAPYETVSAEIAREYAPYVTAELLTEWQDDTSKAPGRLTSSPWPARIEIASVTKKSPTEFAVEGHVIDVTNEGGGINEIPTEAARRPVTLVARKLSTEWKIAQFELGAYPGDGEWRYSEPTSQGIQFMYPEALSTTFVSAQEWPPRVELTANSYSCTEGPIEAADGPLTILTRKMVGDREYCVASFNEGAAGSTYTTFEYTTQQGDFVPRIVFTLRYPQCANYPEPQASACRSEQERFDIDGLVDRIAQSIKMQ